MIYQDGVYGIVEINEPVILDLMGSAPLCRLESINQYGAICYRLPQFSTTRFQHSVGTCLLLKKLGASLEEQISGLLHDISHMAFSHVVDAVFDREISDDFHHRFYKDMLVRTDISRILKKHGFKPEQFFDQEKFSLSECPIPDPCADRLDYAMRDFLIYRIADHDEVQQMLANMTVRNNKIVFLKRNIAKKFGFLFFKIADLYGGPLNSTCIRLLADAIKIALEKKILSKKDLTLVDEEVYEKLLQSGDKSILSKLDLLKRVEVEENNQEYDYFLQTKIRVVDPFVYERKRLVRLSEVDKEFDQAYKEFFSRRSQGVYVKIINK